jgi:leucyl/phenylalanyl-tRNA--protein transferase
MVAMFASRNPHRLDTFPPVDEADDEGLLAIGGDLSPERLLLAYRSGIFPWFEEGFPVLWWSPDPRAIIELDELHVARRLARTLKSNRFQLTLDRAFERVMRGCAEARVEGTWITESMIEAYCRLHELGHAHSVEAWQDGALAGGIYGVSIGGFFAGESMFYRRHDASKVALVHLVELLRRCGFRLFDVQILNEHTSRLGAKEISRDEYLRRLDEAVEVPAQLIA